jgi:hypothetical protein
MSAPGMREALASAMQQQGGKPPAPGGPPGGAPAPGGQGGGLGQLAQVYAKCEQSGQCSPQEAQILEQGLPQLVQMAQNIQKILQAVKGGGQQQQPQPGGPPQ